MLVQLNDVHQAFADALEGGKFREELATWARWCFKANDDYNLHIEPIGDERRIKNALSFLCDVADRDLNSTMLESERGRNLVWKDKKAWS
jgi:hypothetical protein